MVDLDTMDGKPVTSYELQQHVWYDNDIINVKVESNEVSFIRYVDGFNNGDFTFERSDFLLYIRPSWRFAWYRGKLYKLPDDCIQCCNTFGEDLFVATDSKVLQHFELEVVAYCNKADAKKRMLLE